MNSDHYAIVIGLKHYAGFKDPPADLCGPENDADAVYKWLVDADGGNLPEKNVKRIKSSDEKPPDGKPLRETLETAFDWIDSIAQDNQAKERGRMVGRRLYFYMSGHGFSPQVKQGCLLAGNASPERVSANIGASRWLQWWQDAGYFQEYVLLMDCCMNRITASVAEASPAPLKPIYGGQAAGPAFVAFAAQRPLKAVEIPIPAGSPDYHGIFTWAFLQGLRGAAANSSGMVTGHSMANWLRNAVFPWLGEVDRNDPDVSKEPDIVAEDPRIIFARGVAPLLFPITLKFPDDAVGQAGRIWSGTAPPKPVDFTVVGELVHQTPAGLHLVEVPGAGYRQGFEVVRPDTFEIRDKGPGVTPPTGGLMSLAIDPGDESAGISLSDANFAVVDSVGGRLNSKLPFGLYKTQIRIGRQLVNRVILLDRDVTQVARSSDSGGLESLAVEDPDAIALPKIASPVPLPDGNMSHEYQADAARDATLTELPESLGAELTVMARSFTEGDKVTPDAEPWSGIEVVDQAGAVVLDLATHGALSNEQGKDPFALATIALAPGAYFLRHSLGPKQHFEQTLVVAKGWRLEVYVLRRIDPSTSRPDTRPRLSFLMRKLGTRQEIWPEPGTELLEKARVALADERPIVNDQIDELLFRKYKNPIAGIIGGHLLLLRSEQNKGGDLALLNEVVPNLRNLVGSPHPDVEALSLRCPDKKLRCKKPFPGPPMFERSWRLMVEASQSAPSLIPLSLWQRILAQAPIPPFFAWSIDGKVQEDRREALAAALGEQPSARGSAVVAEGIVLESLAPAADAKPVRPKRSKSGDGARKMKDVAKSLHLPPVALQAVLKQRDKD